MIDFLQTTLDGVAVGSSYALLAIGSIPNSEGLGLDAAGVEVDGGGYVVVNHNCQSSVPHIYAGGDAVPKCSASSLMRKTGFPLWKATVTNEP